MSRPQKMHKPLKGGFNEILAAVAMGRNSGKKAAKELQATPAKPAALEARDAGPAPKKP
jgi:hypothetical protein